MANDPCRVRPQEVILELGPVRAHDDQVGLDFLGRVEDFPVDRAVADPVLDRDLRWDVLGASIMPQSRALSGRLRARDAAA
jgi:hypothetical protein